MKSFFKQVSIYGILPVVGKFIGFFLVPIYVRIFSAAEFGIVELLVTLVNFLMFACNLEFYTAIGRFYYENDSSAEKKKLVSTGLYLTLFFTSIVVFFAFLAEDSIINFYLKSNNYRFAYRLGIIYLIFAAIYTYLSVLPRYDKRPKLFVVVQTISILIRVGSTIFYVLYLKWGVIGVIAGHLTGAFAASLLNVIISRKYIGTCFDWQYAKDIAKFAIPLVPGLLLVGFWNPLSRSMISEFYSLEAVGYLAFAIRITMFMAIINGAINMAWNPILFEEFKKPDFIKNLEKVSFSVGTLVFSCALVITLLAPEITFILGSKEYAPSIVLIGFLSFQGGLEILRRLRGFGPLIYNKTYIYTINEIIGITVGVILIIVLNPLGIIGIGLAFLIPSLLKYLLLVRFTCLRVNIDYHKTTEILLVVMLNISIMLLIFDINPFIRYISLLFVTGFVMNKGKKKLFNIFYKKCILC